MIFEEDFPGQKREMERQQAIAAAVAAADIILMDCADSAEELDYLTSAVTEAFMQKVHGRNLARIVAEDLKTRV